jgi:hypothetical protein
MKEYLYAKLKANKIMLYTLPVVQEGTGKPLEKVHGCVYFI